MLAVMDIFKKYGVSLQEFKASQTILFIGTLPSKDDESKTKRVCQDAKNLIYFSPMEDSVLQQKAKKYIKYEVGSEAGVLALLAKSILSCRKLSKDERDYLDELDEGYLSAESNVGEEEIDEVLELLEEGSITFLFGKDIEEHFDLETIIALTALISRFQNISVSLFSGGATIEKTNCLLPPRIEELKSFDGIGVYFYPSENDNEKLYGSSQFAIAAKIQDKDEVVIAAKEGEYKRIFELSDNIKGTIAVLGTNRHNGFRYEIVNIKRVANG